jgi:hypothetical protein
MSFTPKVYFISTQYLRENTPIEDNVDDDKIAPFIIQAQDTYLQEGIGETFYNRLKEGVQNNDLNYNELAFMRNFVQPLVAQYAFYLMFPFLNYKATNKSIAKESSEFSTPSELDEIKYLRSSILDLAEFYKRRMIKWLSDFPGTFPQYDNPSARDNMPKSYQSYFNGIYMPYPSKMNNIRNYSEPFGPLNPCGGCTFY